MNCPVTVIVQKGTQKNISILPFSKLGLVLGRARTLRNRICSSTSCSNHVPTRTVSCGTSPYSLYILAKWAYGSTRLCLVNPTLAPIASLTRSIIICCFGLHSPSVTDIQSLPSVLCRSISSRIWLTQLKTKLLASNFVQPPPNSLCV